MAARADKVAARSHETLLQAALGSMPYGFSVWDEAHRLILFNDAYLAMYRLPRDRVAVGMSLADSAALSVEMGNHPDLTAAQLLAVYEARLSPDLDPATPIRTQKAIRGRVIDTTHIRSPGIGWIIIHEDVTDAVEQQWMAELREKSLADQNLRFDAALRHMPLGLSMYDAESRLVICNERYRELYDLPAELTRTGTLLDDILGYRAAHGVVAIDLPENFVEAVPLDDERHGKRVQVYRLPDGRVVSVHRSLMANGGFVTTHEDVTAQIERLQSLERSQAQLATQSLRFMAAVDNMLQGLCMFDKDSRLVVCNAAYAALYELPPGLCQPGTPHSDIVAHRTSHGMKPVNSEGGSFMSQHWKILDDKVSQVVTVELADGRLISIHHQPMADGGWVATHQDVTEEHRRIAAIEASERILKIQNMRFDAAVNNMSQGLCMFDRDSRLVVCNEPYARIYNLPARLTVPGTPFNDILEHRFASGIVPREGREAYVSGRKALVANAIEAKDEVEMEDGRVIAIQHHPIPDGGWVATHEDITEQRRIEARVRHLARHDALTDLPNRVVLREEMEKLESRIARGEMVAVLCLDLDHFKAVNDTLGHGVGDQVLMAVARRLRECSRENDVVARLGGDEFALLIHSLESPRDAAIVAGRIVRKMAEPIPVDNQQIMIGASVGIAVAPGDGGDSAALLKNADMALYRAKSEGRGNFHFFEKGMDEALQRRRLLELGLKVALARGELRLVFQPLLNLEENRVCCLEALLRWDHPERGLISPGEFVPVAEETGMITPIGEWVLREACLAATRWPEHVRVAVNLSPVQFKNRGLVGQVQSALKNAGLSPNRLELEITESLLLAETDLTLKTLHRLRALGVRISMDDFGTGYSSLSYLRSFPFDKIKIDRSFMNGVSPQKDSMAIIKAVIGLGQSLGMSTTAEGIETEEQLEAVRAQGCSEVQGFLFSPPLPASGVDALLGTLSATPRRQAG